MINCIIVDDEPLALEILKNYIEKIPFLNLIGEYTDAIKVLTDIGKYSVDLIFCDIEMPDINGIQFAESLKSSKRPMFVMVSAHNKYAIEGFNLDAIDYLLKPFSFSRFLKTTQKVLDYHTTHNSKYETIMESVSEGDDSTDFIFVKSNNKLLKINFSNIIYIESLSDYIKIHIEDSTRSILSLSSLKSLDEVLPSNQFKRIHRSYIVSLSKIKAIENRRVLVGTNVSLPISNSYYDDLYNSLVHNNILR